MKSNRSLIIHPCLCPIMLKMRFQLDAMRSGQSLVRCLLLEPLICGRGPRGVPLSSWICCWLKISKQVARPMGLGLSRRCSAGAIRRRPLLSLSLLAILLQAFAMLSSWPEACRRALAWACSSSRWLVTGGVNVSASSYNGVEMLNWVGLMML